MQKSLSPYSVLICLTTSFAPGSAEVTRIEAETLTENARIINGGDLLLVSDPKDSRIQFSGGKAISFAPRGKGSSLQLDLPCTTPGVYRIHVKGAMGPSCGLYNLVVGDEVRGWFNFSAEKTVHTDRSGNTPNGIATKRVRLIEGKNPVRFEFLQPGGRGGCLVIDSIHLFPHRFVPHPVPDKFDSAIPENESHADELIRNGGFEEFQTWERFEQKHQKIRHWSLNTSAPADHRVIVRAPAKARTGKHCIRLSPDDLEDNVVLYQTIRAESRARYRVIVHARGEGTIRVDFYQYGGRPRSEDAERVLNVFKATDTWQRYTFVMSPSEAGKIHQVAIALYALEGSSIYFDDISIRRITEKQ